MQPGDTVYGSDHGEIGKVEKVVEATDVTEGYLLVPSGLIFKTDTYIPLDAVVKRIGTDVFINIPKLDYSNNAMERTCYTKRQSSEAGPCRKRSGKAIWFIFPIWQ
ncbi:MAG: hypothetical protein WKF59_09245 [Chitinophagaceae bacterium]